MVREGTDGPGRGGRRRPIHIAEEGKDVLDPRITKRRRKTTRRSRDNEGVVAPGFSAIRGAGLVNKGSQGLVVIAVSELRKVDELVKITKDG